MKFYDKYYENKADGSLVNPGTEGTLKYDYVGNKVL